MNEAHVHVFKTSSVRNVSLCVCMTSLSHTEHGNSWPNASASAGTGDVVINENVLWLINMLPYSVSDRASQTPNTKKKKKNETQLNNISGTVFNLNMLVMQYSLIRNNLTYFFEAIGAPCWLTLVCQFVQVLTLFCPKDDKWMKTCLN